MGEARRRTEQGLPPRQPSSNGAAKGSGGTKARTAGQRSGGGKGADDAQLVPWLPLSRRQADQFVQWSTRGAWVGIGALVLFWLTVRFLGPALGWWTLADG